MKIEMTPEQIAHSVAVETRNWLAKGVVPPMAAAVRRENAKQFPLMAPLHNAIADEWDRIAAAQPEKMIKAWERRLNDAITNRERQDVGTRLNQYWDNIAADARAQIFKIDPNYETAR